METYLLRSRRLLEYRAAAARAGVPLATWLRDAADRALVHAAADRDLSALPAPSIEGAKPEPVAAPVAQDADRARLCHRSWAHMPGRYCVTCGTDG